MLPLAIALGLMMPLAHAQKKTDPAKDKPAAPDTKKPAPKAKEAAPDKKKVTKPEELSDSDKALLADAKKEADALTPTQQAKLLELLNKGDAAALEAVEGIGEIRAENIIKKRPFTKAEDAAMVDGIGIETFKNLCASVKGGAKPEKTAPAKPKTEKPKSEEKPEKPKTTKPATTKKD